MTGRAIVLLQDEERRLAALAAVQAAGRPAVAVSDLRGLANELAGGAELLVLEGPFAVEPGPDLLARLRALGVDTPALFVCDSQLELSSLQGGRNLRPYIALDRIDAEAFRVALEDVGSARPLERGQIPTEGSLAEHGLADLFLHLLAEGWTGTLELASGGTAKVVFFSDGHPVYCSSNILSENFGQMLLRRGVITEIEYEWARKLQLREGIRQGEALVKIGVLSHRDLFDHLRDQIREKIVNAFGWTEGRFALRTGGDELQSVTRFELNGLGLAIEGLERFHHSRAGAAEWEQLRHQWAVVACDRPAIARAAGQAVARSVLRALTHPQLLADLALQAGWDRAHATSTFGTLRRGGFIQVAERPEVLPPAHGLEAPGPEAQAPTIEVPIAIVADRTDEAKRLSESLWKAYLRLSYADYFAILGVSRTAGLDEIRAARDEILDVYSNERFRLVLDQVQNIRALEEVQNRIHLAAEVLLSAERRASYVASLPAEAERSRRQVLSAEDEFQAGLSVLDTDPAAAHGHFSRALTLNASEPLYMLYCGWAGYAGGASEADRAEGRRLMVRSVAANPALDDGYALLAEVYVGEGNRDEAAEQARTALAFNPDNARARALLARLEASS